MIDEAVLTTIREDVQDRLKTFATSYTTAYKNALVGKLLESKEEEGAEGAEGEDARQLQDEDEEGAGEKKDILLSGWATKRGGVVKNWKKRYFELYEDSFAYFEKPDASPKGTFNLGGYTLVRNPNALKMTIKTQIYKEINVADPVEEYTKCKCRNGCV